MLKFIGKQHIIEIQVPISYTYILSYQKITIHQIGVACRPKMSRDILPRCVYSTRLAGDPQGGLVLE